MNNKVRLIFCIAILSNLGACVGNMNPTGGNGRTDYPYYITTQPMIVKKINVPIGTKLEYEEQLFKSGQQDSLLNEKKTHQDFLPSRSINELGWCTHWFYSQIF